MSVRFTPRAFRELSGLYRYLLSQSPQGAAAVLARVEDLLDALSAQPRIGVRVGSRKMRRASAQPYPYFIFYRATRDGITVHGLRHAARNPQTMPSGDG